MNLSKIRPAIQAMLQNSCLAVMLMFGATVVASAATPPETVVKKTFDHIIQQIEINRQDYRENPQALYSMVDEVLGPVIHIQSIANKILGKHGRSASLEQREQFAEEFKKTLIFTYGILLLEFNGQELAILPSKVVDESRVVVKTELRAGSQTSIPINFFMSNRDEENWTARNLEGAGINFVSNYRATYGPNIAKNGLDAVIAELRAKNAILLKAS